MWCDWGGRWHYRTAQDVERILRLPPLARSRGPGQKFFLCGKSAYDLGRVVPDRPQDRLCPICAERFEPDQPTKTDQPLKNDMPFLPSDYEPPKGGGNYLKIKEGEEVRLRLLGSFEHPKTAVMGWLVWVPDEAGGQQPERRTYTQEGFTDLKGLGEVPRHFWAIAVWDQREQCLKVWEITQAQIRNQITELAQSEDWGDPSGYDLKIKRSGTGQDTKYAVIPLPPLGAPVPEAMTALKEVDLREVFKGADPFTPAQSDDIPI